MPKEVEPILNNEKVYKESEISAVCVCLQDLCTIYKDEFAATKAAKLGGQMDLLP